MLLLANTNITSSILTGGMPINWTTVIGIITISLASMGTLIKIFSSTRAVKEEDLRESPIIKEISQDAKDAKKRQEDMKETANLLKTEVEKLKIESANNNKTLEELRKDYRELVSRLDDLLRQLLEWVNT